MTKNQNFKGLKIIVISLFFVLVGGIIFIITSLVGKINLNETENNVKENIACEGGKIEIKGKLEDYSELDGIITLIIQTKKGKSIKKIDYCLNKVISEIEVQE